MDSSPKWSQLYGADPAMDWSRYQPVDPKKFDAAVFAKDSAAAATRK